MLLQRKNYDLSKNEYLIVFICFLIESGIVFYFNKIFLFIICARIQSCVVV